MVKPEKPLEGGHMTEVARLGDQVLREAGPWTPTIQRLLAHLSEQGLEWVPEPLGLDERGRETVRFIPGEVPNYPLPAYVWDERTLGDAGRMLRVLHDAAAGYADPEARWRQPVHEPVETVCHNDVAPYNMVFREGRLVGLIDFDMASPGSRLWDFSYLAYRLAPLSAPGNVEAGPFGTAAQQERLRRLVDAYGMPFAVADVLRAAQARLRDLARYSDEAAARNGTPELHAHAALYRADVVYIGRVMREAVR